MSFGLASGKRSWKTIRYSDEKWRSPTSRYFAFTTLHRAREIAVCIAKLPPRTGSHIRIALTQKVRRMTDESVGYRLELEGISAAGVARSQARLETEISLGVSLAYKLPERELKLSFRCLDVVIAAVKVTSSLGFLF